MADKTVPDDWNDGVRGIVPQPPAPVAPAESVAPTASELAQDQEILSEFIAEASEHILSIESNLLVLEQDPTNANALQSVFRSFHSIKGLAGFLDLPVLQEVSHEVENLLALAREGTLAVDSSMVDVALEGGDFIKRSVRR